MSPLALHMLIWFHTRPLSTPFDGIENDPQQEIVRRFLADGIIDRADFPALTDRGRAWLDMILETPMPVQQWADPRVNNRLPADYVSSLQRAEQKPAAPPFFEDYRNPGAAVPPGYTPHDGTGRPPIWNENGKVGMPDVVLIYRGLPKPKQQRPNRLPLGSVNWKWGATPSNDDVIGYRIAEVE